MKGFFRVIDPLCEEFTDEFPLQRANNTDLFLLCESA